MRFLFICRFFLSRFKVFDGDVYYYIIFSIEFFFVFFFDIDESVCSLCFVEVEIFVDLLLDGGIECIWRERIEGGVFGYCDIGDDKIRVVLGYIVMDDIWKDFIVLIEESDDEECEDGDGEELNVCVNLCGRFGVSIIF